MVAITNENAGSVAQSPNRGHLDIAHHQPSAKQTTGAASVGIVFIRDDGTAFRYTSNNRAVAPTGLR
jgi:hypothetical protein